MAIVNTTVLANGFAAGEVVSISFNGTSENTSCVANSAGDCSTSALVPVDLPAGTYSVGATGQTCDLSAQTPFSTLPSLSLTPSSGPAGSTFNAVATGYAADESVNFSFGPTHLGSCSANASGDCTAGLAVPSGANGNNIVTGTGASSGDSAQAAFQVTSTFPTLSSLTPKFGRNAGGTALTVTGANFAAPASVHFGGAAATGVIVINSTRITAISPSGTGSVDVTVTTPGGTSPTSSADLFTYLAPPTVSALSPSSGLLGGGNSVTITGTNFAGGVTVRFGAAAATGVTVVNSTTVTALAPAGTGTVNVVVTTPGGTSAASAADRYSY